jgi:hypothetical protein
MVFVAIAEKVDWRAHSVNAHAKWLRLFPAGCSESLRSVLRHSGAARQLHLSPGRTAEDVRNYLRYLAGQSHLQEIHFLWRPFLRDADDDMVLELAFAAGCRHLVTHNVKDFSGSEQLGVTALSPREFLNLIRQKS